MIKHAPQSWKDDLRENFDSDLNFYINPRCRTIPALTSTGVTYIANDSSTNMRGSYRMQCGGTTSLTYLYTLPQRFIIEGWFKPEFAYNVATDQFIFRDHSTPNMGLYYVAAQDNFTMHTKVAATNNYIFTDTFLSDAELQNGFMFGVSLII